MRKVMAITTVIGLITIAMINISSFDIEADVQYITNLSTGDAEEIIIFYNDGDTKHINLSIPGTATITKAVVSLEGKPILDSVTLGQPSLVTNDIDDKDSTAPSFTLDNNGNCHLAWVDNGNIQGSGNDYDVYYRYKPQLSPIWAEIILISDATQNSNSIQPTITVDSQNNTYVAWVDDANYLGSGNDNDILFRSCTGGTWTSIIVISDDLDDGVSSNPYLIADIEDNVHLVWVDNGNIDGSGTDTDIIYRKYNSTTLTWEIPTVISNQNNDGESRNPSLLAVNEYIHVVWEDNSNYSGNGDDYDILHRYWDPTSNTWSTTTTVSTNISDGESVNASMGAGINKIGDVYVIWEDDGNINASGNDIDIAYRKLSFKTTTWSNLTLISNLTNDGKSVNPYIFPGLFDNLHTIWCDNGDISGSGTDFDIIHKRFDGTLQTYSSPIVLTTDADDGDSITPAIESVMDLNQNLETFYYIWVDDGDIAGSGVDADIYHQTHQINYSYPSNLKIDVGNKGRWGWNCTYVVNSSINIGDNTTSNWFSRELNSIIENTSNNNEPVMVPIKFYSSTQGLLKIHDLNITYTLVPGRPTDLKILHELDDMHLLNHTPVLSWTFNDEDSEDQGWYELEVGTLPGGNDMWDPSPTQSPETSLNYSGLELVDGETYYFRVRTRDNDGSRWSRWSENKSFRFNTPPEIEWLKPVEGNYSYQINISWSTSDAENDDVYVTLEANYSNKWHELMNLTRSEFKIWDVSIFTTQTVDIRVLCWDGFEYSRGGWFNPDGKLTIHRNTPPIIKIVAPPPHGVKVDKKVKIQWEINDPDVNDDHTVDLFYDVDTDYQDKVLIKNDLTSVLEYVWDTSTIEDGVYYICALVNDGTDSGYTYSEGKITVDHTVETLPPKILMIYPPLNSDDIPVDIDIWVRFNIPIDGNTVTSKTFMVYDSLNNQVKGEVSYNGENLEAKFDPENNLSYSEVYLVHITTGIRDLAGNGLDGDFDDISETSEQDDFTWTFTTRGQTGDIKPPRVISSFPINNATNVDNNIVIVITFSEDMDENALLNNALFLDTSGAEVPVNKSFSRETFQLTITPRRKLMENMTYMVIVTSAAKDLAGRSLDGNGNGESEGSPHDDYWLTFTTGSVIDTDGSPPPENITDDSEEGLSNMELFFITLMFIIIILMGIALLVFRKIRHGGFEITNIFIIYNDGRLLTRYHRKTDRTIDDSAVSSMLTAIQDFIHDSFKDSAGKKGSKSESVSGESFDELRYGKLRIYIEYDKNFYIAVIGEGQELPGNIRKQLKKIKNEINLKYHKVLEYWDGNMAQVKGMRELLEPLMKK
jgi:hypothetical protein